MFNPNVTVKNMVTTPTAHALIALLARVFMAYIFLIAGWGKINAYAGTAGYMEMMGIPGSLLPLVILIEIGGGLALLVGFQTRIVALGLAIFTLVAGMIFHVGGATPEQITNNSIHLMKNIAITGGFLFVMLQGAGKFSIDNAIEK
ncbi:DoxX family protein [Acinetobacter sp. GSS19]|uniref:DoxX family protein n=1 Tax=Acinetobacter sp. GSS19 TaxID=3020716 RepID=UPI002361FB95|nr:DoxX family protein [Acinetobacter sp. GSS19]